MNTNHFAKDMTDMPYANVKITREGATAEQKADNWGDGGEPVTVRRKAGK